MKLKKTTLAVIVASSIGIGWLTLGGTQVILDKTSSTEFCLSCHSMETSYKEYLGSVHFSNAKGIRAECSDCHIPQEPMEYLWTKIRATKDVYHEFVTGKIDTDEKYEQHRAAMAETVWEQMRSNDSATCRSCHDEDAMETYEQSEEAQKMHLYAAENDQTCIDCHKGVAHLPPESKMDSTALDHLLDEAKTTPADAKVVYPVQTIAMGDLGSINPATPLKNLKDEGGKRQVELSGYQMQGAEQVLYMGEGQRAIIAALTKDGESALKAGEFKADAYGNQWRPVSLVATIEAPVLDSQQPLWNYAEQLDNVFCSTCHAKIPANHFTVNAWPSVAKGMGDRTSISAEDLEILTKFFQYNAKDVVGH